LSCPHNLNKGAIDDQIQKVATCPMALPIPYFLAWLFTLANNT
jgi:hypothetical protein